MELGDDIAEHSRTLRSTPGNEAAVASPTGTQAVDRAAQLLKEVVHGPDPVTFTELTAATGLAKSTTSRLLMALERGGLVRRDAHGHFQPGDMFVRYAWRGGAEAGLVAVARPFLDRLGEATGETVNLGVASNGMVEQIAQVDSTYLIGGTNWVGLSVPLHCAALGKVLLAYGVAKLPPGRLEHRTARTITSRTAVAADLAEVRRRGYAVTDEELEPGLIAVAAPVYSGGAAVAAALSVSGPASRLTRARITDVAASCVAQASALSAALGHQPAGNGRAAQPARNQQPARQQPQREGAA
jgi:IclR family transcriptional regulator, acetate operon repressor